MSDNTTSFTLSNPLRTHDGEVTELSLRQPLARSFIKAGVPFNTVTENSEDGTQKVEFRFNTKAMFVFLADMSGLDEIILGKIAGSDVMPLFYTVVAMLGERQQPAD
jgi:hypothetical protein